ncbi:MAG: hypothetical protein IIB95_03835 [Candidatus Marinimicrobia bacterium]|nr:hypothetical protein [Candidatus Neomarinimicrobiota bacterium]
MKKTLDEIRAGYPLEKQKSDPLWAKIIIRRLSFYLTWILVRLNISAWQVSVFSIGMPIIALIFWIRLEPITAAVLLNVWLLLDCVDGNIARLEGGSKGGSFVDASSGYMMVGTFGLGLGIFLDLTGTGFYNISSPWFTIMGAGSSILNLMARLYHQKFFNVMNNSLNNGTNNNGGILHLIERNIGIGGILTPITFLCVIMNKVHILLFFYFLYSASLYVKTAGELLKKAK